MARKFGKIEVGARDSVVRYYKFANIGLREFFETARDIDRVADRSDGGGATITHFADDHRTAMNSDADPQGALELYPQRRVELGEPLRHQPRCSKRLPTPRLCSGLDPEKRHHPVTDKFVDAASCGFHGAAHGREIAIEDKYHIVREPAFGKRGKIANVGKQDRDLSLASLHEIDLDSTVRSSRKRWQQRCYFDVAARTQLASKANIIGRGDASEDASLERLG